MSPLPHNLTREESDALAKRRRGRNWAVLIALLALTALFYAITVARMGVHPA
jgi:hypothetical protein